MAKGLNKLEHDNGIPLLYNFFIHWVLQVTEERQQAE